MDRVETAAAQVLNQMNGALAVCTEENMPWFVYEGGQHLVLANSGGVVDATLHTAISEANRSQRMGDLYRTFWTQVAARAKVVAAYDLVDKNSAYGYWGAFETWDRSTPKWTALANVAQTVNRRNLTLA
jgi:hypothetical protein